VGVSTFSKGLDVTKIFGILAFLVVFSGCSSMRSVALKTAAPLFMDSMAGIEGEGSWLQFKMGTPANLTLIDGLLAVRPLDENLLAAAIKGNAGYGFGVEETLYLEDKLAEVENSVHKERALYYYTKAFNYGLKYLEANDLSLDELTKSLKTKQGIVGLLDSQLSGDMTSLESMLYMGQSLGSMVNLQRENIQMVSYLPLAKGIFDWVCDVKRDIAHGMCDIFYGSYEAGRPAMLGGNPEKGREIFEKFIKENPANWLARVSFLEHFAIPQYDEDIYLSQKKDLEKFVVLHKEQLKWSPSGDENPMFANKRLRLFQAIAVKRFEIIKKYEKDIF